ncbi:MAG: ImmA/IrrE family metallo-endopeptidase [Ruminococcaceae bacterium]|nr:ImmA/IrrE family metallo-endopeptidase [Oscillospiraceae bacterium]
MNVPKKKAIEFVRKYKLKENRLTCETMRDIIRRQGFLVFRHDKFGQSSEKVDAVLRSLKLTDYAIGKDGFVYASSTDKAVFINSQLSEDEELYILLHEEGHISCNHPVQHGVLAYNNVLCEQEANAFVFYVMQYLKHKNTSILASVACTLLLDVGVSFAANTPPPTQNDTPNEAPTASSPASAKIETVTTTPVPLTSSSVEANENLVYVAKTGTVYHKENCSYISGRTGVRQMTVDSAQTLDLSPCSRCRPDTE